jgi:NAD-specific glutamate dehydrogenase
VAREVARTPDAIARPEQWLQGQAVGVERWQRVVAEIRNAHVQEYAMYAVAVRGLLELSQPVTGLAH